MTADAFGTAALRRSVLQAWASSPTRLREDANTEEDHAHGSYRDRVVVEIAQNAADAAARAGRYGQGRLHLGLHAPSGSGEPWVLRAANTGAPLDASGVASLAAMRASAATRAPGAQAVGRFGVGFAALRSVADVVRIGAQDRAVEMSLDRTRAVLDDLVRDAPGLAPLVAARGDRLPVLRLPFPAYVDAASPWDTVVELELRDDTALVAVRDQLAAVDDTLLLALPALAEITVAQPGGAERRVADVADRWVVARADGEVPASVRASLPVEDRDRTAWSVTWAAPRGGLEGSRAATVLHAPTPTDEPLSFPALLLASFPLDPSRRHVVPGPLTDLVAEAAGRAYAGLVADLAPDLGARVLDLVPVALPAGAVDATVRATALAALTDTPVLRLADGPGLVAPADARILTGPVGSDPGARAALGVVNLVDVPPDLHAVARSLGVEPLDLADVVEQLPAVADAPRLRTLYAALSPHLVDADVRDALGALPVLLADGRVVRGARGLLVVDPGADPLGDTASPARRLAALGLRVVDPRAAHEALERLGARRVDLGGVVAEPALRARVLDAARAADDGEDPDTDDLLALVRDVVGQDRGTRLPFWWGELPVPTTDDELVAVRGCALPGTWAHEVLDGLDVVADDVVARWGSGALRALGAAAGLEVLLVRDVVTPVTGTSADLDGSDDVDPHTPEGWLSAWSDYLAHLADVLGPGAYVGDVAALADLDAVRPDAWAEVLALVAGDPALRAALLEPVRAQGAGRRVAPSYTAWWLREELGAPFALGPVPWLPPTPASVSAAVGIDGQVLAAVGGVTDLTGIAPGDWPAVLDRMDDAGTPVPVLDALALWRALGVLAADGATLDPLPGRLPALTAGGVRVVPATEAVVAPDPMWAPLRPVVPAPAGHVDDVADLLDLDVVPDAAPAPDARGRERAVPAEVEALLRSPAHVWYEHDELRVGGVAVDWWVAGTGEGQGEGRGDHAATQVHATGLRALAEGLAAASGTYALRHLLAAVLADPRDADRLVAATAWDGTGPVVPAQAAEPDEPSGPEGSDGTEGSGAAR